MLNENICNIHNICSNIAINNQLKAIKNKHLSNYTEYFFAEF